MRPSLSIKTLFRSPARTILTFVLLGVASFALFTQVSGYATLVYKADVSAAIAGRLYRFAGLYFAVIVAAAALGSTFATWRSALELLQTKE